MKKITAIIRADRLKRVEETLKTVGADGVSTSSTKGFGEYADFFRDDWLVRHMRIEVFARDGDVDRLIEAIVTAARTGVPGDGIVAVEPVERFLHVRKAGNEPPERTGSPAPLAGPEAGRSASVARATVVGFTALAMLATAFVAFRHQVHYLVGVTVVVLAALLLIGVMTSRSKETREG